MELFLKVKQDINWSICFWLVRTYTYTFDKKKEKKNRFHVDARSSTATLLVCSRENKNKNCNSWNSPVKYLNSGVSLGRYHESFFRYRDVELVTHNETTKKMADFFQLNFSNALIRSRESNLHTDTRGFDWFKTDVSRKANACIFHLILGLSSHCRNWLRTSDAQSIVGTKQKRRE